MSGFGQNRLLTVQLAVAVVPRLHVAHVRAAPADVRGLQGAVGEVLEAHREGEVDRAVLGEAGRVAERPAEQLRRVELRLVDTVDEHAEAAAQRVLPIRAAERQLRLQLRAQPRLAHRARREGDEDGDAPVVVAQAAREEEQQQRRLPHPAPRRDDGRRRASRVAGAQPPPPPLLDPVEHALPPLRRRVGRVGEFRLDVGALELPGASPPS
eukprot:gene9844-biopygen1676